MASSEWPILSALEEEVAPRFESFSCIHRFPYGGCKIKMATEKPGTAPREDPPKDPPRDPRGGSTRTTPRPVRNAGLLAGEAEEKTPAEKMLDSERPTINMVRLLVHRALAARASDIHLEPFEEQLLVRFRIDGVLQQIEEIPVSAASSIVSRLKVMASLDTAERRLPQDGHIEMEVDKQDVDMRVATLPTIFGESMVLRLLHRTQVSFDFRSLGFDMSAQALFTAIRRPHGILLVTGPTGSGKTTTLYTALQTLNLPRNKVVTVEDPVEYQIEGVNQVQVKPGIGLDFARSLRSIVRHDPDIIMIGEMRDYETASIAVQSALTGHLVFSTLHTNDAGSAVTRLLDIGVEPYLLTSTINGILAQRLVRLLCRKCRYPVDTPLQKITKGLRLPPPPKNWQYRFFKARGCKHCEQTGYHGRTAIYEFMPMGENLRKLILDRADGTTIQETAIKLGMLSMRESGIYKALLAKTSLEEVMRVTLGSVIEDLIRDTAPASAGSSGGS